MSKLYAFNMVTVDGFFEGANKWDIGWHNVDAEFNDYAIEQMDHNGVLVFGRVTYEGMASYWPSPAAIKDDPIVAGKMNAIPKIVFSKTLEKAEWNNTRIMKDVNPEEINQLKQEPGKDIAIFGSANLMAAFARHRLVDEYRLIVNPILLGKGAPLFGGMSETLKLKLLRMKKFKSGNVLLVYQAVMTYDTENK